MGEDIEISNLGFGLDFDLERVDPGGEDSGEPLTRERVEEVATRLGYVLESTPAFNHTNARLIYATSDDAIRIPHFDRWEEEAAQVFNLLDRFSCVYYTIRFFLFIYLFIISCPFLLRRIYVVLRLFDQAV